MSAQNALGEETVAVADDVGLGRWTVCGGVGSAVDSMEQAHAATLARHWQRQRRARAEE